MDLPPPPQIAENVAGEDSSGSPISGRSPDHYQTRPEPRQGAGASRKKPPSSTPSPPPAACTDFSLKFAMIQPKLSAVFLSTQGNGGNLIALIVFAAPIRCCRERIAARRRVLCFLRR